MFSPPIPLDQAIILPSGVGGEKSRMLGDKAAPRRVGKDGPPLGYTLLAIT